MLQQAIADMDNRPMDPKSYNALDSYKNQLQHTNTTEKLLNQKRDILRQQQATGATPAQLQQTEIDIKALEKKLVREQQKLHTAEQNPALQKVIEQKRVQKDLQDTAMGEGTADYLQVFKRTSEYRNTAGEFDIDRAISDYNEFLTTTPEKNKMYLQQSLESVGFEQRKLQDAIFGYSAKNDTIYYDPSNPDFWFMDFVVANTHELAHRIDAYFVNAADSKAFHDAILKAKQIVANDPELFIEYSKKNDVDGFLSDILSAISDDDYEFYTGHPTEYWQEVGRKEREIFANMFSLESCNDWKKLEFIKEHFQEIYQAYMNFEFEVK